MLLTLLILSVLNVVLCEHKCYFNADCPYQLYSSVSPYETSRGDIRDHVSPENCEAISLWSLNRHGNQNPSATLISDFIALQQKLIPEIISSYESGSSHLCAQDIENFRKWTWNTTIQASPSFLTGEGYEETYNIAKRVREKYSHLFNADNNKYYFRPTNEQSTVTSAMAYIQGLAEGSNLILTIDGPWDRDEVIRPCATCDRFQQEVRNGQALIDELDDYHNTAEYIAVRNDVQKRLGITTQLTSDDIYNMYEMCRYHRSWSPTLRSPWCSVFSDEDLMVLEYRDDVRHYHRNGCGSWVNKRLGEQPMKDLFENFEAAVNNNGRNVVGYFTHDTVLGMAFCTAGFFHEPTPIRGFHLHLDRLWRTSYIASFSSNLLAVLNRCQESGVETHRVQFFINEKVTNLCPDIGCSWDEFVTKFQPFTNANLDFCSMDYVPDSATVPKSLFALLSLLQLILLL